MNGPPTQSRRARESRFRFCFSELASHTRIRPKSGPGHCPQPRIRAKCDLSAGFTGQPKRRNSNEKHTHLDHDLLVVHRRHPLRTDDAQPAPHEGQHPLLRSVSRTTSCRPANTSSSPSRRSVPSALSVLTASIPRSSTRCRTTPNRLRRTAAWCSTVTVTSTSWRRSGLVDRTWRGIRCRASGQWRLPAAAACLRRRPSSLSPALDKSSGTLSPSAANAPGVWCSTRGARRNSSPIHRTRKPHNLTLTLRRSL